jgi:hypothetical protein
MFAFITNVWPVTPMTLPVTIRLDGLLDLISTPVDCIILRSK